MNKEEYDANDLIDEIISKMREMCGDIPEEASETVSMIDPNTVFDINTMTKCLCALFDGQKVRVDYTYGDGARRHGNVQVYTKDAVLIGEQCAVLAKMMRQCNSVNFTVMKTKDVMMQMWPNVEQKGQ